MSQIWDVILTRLRSLSSFTSTIVLRERLNTYCNKLSSLHIWAYVFCSAAGHRKLLATPWQYYLRRRRRSVSSALLNVTASANCNAPILPNGPGLSYFISGNEISENTKPHLSDARHAPLTSAATAPQPLSRAHESNGPEIRVCIITQILCQPAS